MAFDPATAPNELAISYFNVDCEHRVRVNNTPCCGIISESVGAAHGVDPLMCAQCRRSGSPNVGMLRLKAFQLAQAKTYAALNGFVQKHRPIEYTADVAGRMLRLSVGIAHNLMSMQEQAENLLCDLVKAGRMPLENAIEVVKHPDLPYPEGHAIYAQLQAAHEKTDERAAEPIEERCTDCAPSVGATIWEKAIAYAHATKRKLAAAFGPQAEAELYAARQNACKCCFARDSHGELLYRDGDAPTCGKPFTEQPVRNEKKDGCGCPLKEKWAAAKEQCPLGFW